MGGLDGGGQDDTGQTVNFYGIDGARDRRFRCHFL